MTAELRSKFIDCRGYWIPVKDIHATTATAYVLNDGRVFDK